MTLLIDSLPPQIFEIVGVIGFALYVINYGLLTVNLMTSQSTSYFVMNLMAALFVLIGLTHSFNLASALIQMFWIAISLVAIVIRLRRAPANQPVNQAGNQPVHQTVHQAGNHRMISS